MKKYYLFAALLLGTYLFNGCSGDENEEIPGDVEEVVPSTNHNILIAYFSEPLPDGVDASTSASRLVVNGDVYGSVQYMATVIGEETGGDMVRIQTAHQSDCPIRRHCRPFRSHGIALKDMCLHFAASFTHGI